MTQLDAITHLREIARQHTSGELDFSDTINQTKQVLVDYVRSNGAEDLAEVFETVVDDAAEYDLYGWERAQPASA